MRHMAGIEPWTNHFPCKSDALPFRILYQPTVIAINCAELLRLCAVSRCVSNACIEMGIGTTSVINFFDIWASSASIYSFFLFERKKKTMFRVRCFWKLADKYSNAWLFRIGINSNRPIVCVCECQANHTYSSRKREINSRARACVCVAHSALVDQRNGLMCKAEMRPFGACARANAIIIMV